MATEIDDLMNEDPLKLSDQDLDAIIAYNRKAQGIFEAGGKAEKKEGPKIDLQKIGLLKSEKFDRRF